MHYLS